MNFNFNFVSVHNNAKKELGQYPDILTSCLVNNAYILRGGEINCESREQLTRENLALANKQGLEGVSRDP